METGNRLLRAMCAADRELLVSKSERVALKHRTYLEEPHRPPSHVYFVESGMASIMYRGRGDHTAEIALVGAEGCTGCAVILGVDRSPSGIIVQIAGSARRIPSEALISALQTSASLRRVLMRFVHIQIVQRDETALAATQGTIVERLARWLLMVSDRVQDGDIPLTHDVISVMLSTRRAGVTTALGLLRAQGAVTSARGHMRITDRGKLKEIAGVYYGAPEAEFERLMPVTA